METLLRNEVKLQDYVDTAFKKLFFNVPQNEKPEYNGVQLINSAVIARYLKQLLQNDLRYAPFTFIASLYKWASHESPKRLWKISVNMKKNTVNDFKDY